MDRDRVLTLLGRLEQYHEALAAKQACTLEQYRTDDDLQDIVERRFEKTIQAAIDTASHIVAASGFREPEDYGDLFRVLQEEDALSSELADRMVEMAGFRNVLAHEYAAIDDERVYQHLQDLSRFQTFRSAIHEWLEEQDA